MSEKTKKIIFTSIALGLGVFLFVMYSFAFFDGLSLYDLLSFGVIPFEPQYTITAIYFMLTLMGLLMIILLPILIVINVLSLLCDLEVLKIKNMNKIIKLTNIITISIFFIFTFLHLIFAIIGGILEDAEINYLVLVFQLLFSLAFLIFAVLASKKDSQFISAGTKKIIYDAFVIGISVVLLVFMSVAYIDGLSPYDFMSYINIAFDPEDPNTIFFKVIGILVVIATVFLPLVLVCGILMLLCDVNVIKSKKLTRTFKVLATVFASIYFSISFLSYGLLLGVSMMNSEGFGNFALFLSSILLNVALVTFIAKSKKIDVIAKRSVNNEENNVNNLTENNETETKELSESDSSSNEGEAEIKA